MNEFPAENNEHPVEWPDEVSVNRCPATTRVTTRRMRIAARRNRTERMFPVNP